MILYWNEHSKASRTGMVVRLLTCLFKEYNIKSIRGDTNE